ncbi:MAG: sugar phosphate isomerase/epimerase [Chloroflexota bacterium]|nr:MAG: sugar phosphate isomerase/epimerase [Chloroflexota bacterium]
MLKTLSPGAIGIRGLGLADQIALAGRTGWPGLVVDMSEVVAIGASATRDLLRSANVQAGSWGLPFAWNRDQETFDAGVATLPKIAAAAAEIGCTRVSTYMPSGSNERAFDDNLAWHVSRFRPIATILRDYGCAFGIEYIGPKTFQAQFTHPFVRDLDGFLRVRDAIGAANVGLLLDAWHLWHTGTVDDIDRLTAADITVVHVNDAPPGTTPKDELTDTVRALPTETGRIPLGAFMRKVAALGYDGPVTPEPFSQRLNDLAATDPDAAARDALASMDALWRAGGLA